MTLPRAVLFCVFLNVVPLTAQTSWQQITTAPTDINTIVYRDGKIYGSGVYHVYCSSDEGSTWGSADSGIAVDNLGRRMTQALSCTGTSLLISSSVGTGSVYRSSDNGLTWTGVLTNTGIRKFVGTTSHVYALANSAIYKSMDDGLHWQQTTSSLTSTFSITANDSFLFSCSLTSILRSTDDGFSWQPTGLNTDFIVAMMANESEIFAGSDFGGVWRSTNNGLSWTRSALDSLFNITLFDAGMDLYDGTDRGLFRSTDRGGHWSFFGLSGSISTVASIAASESHLFALTNGGTKFWIRSLPTPTSVADNSAHPDRILLEQNYPNPFNPTTTIRYAIPHASFVRLTIHNVLGQEVATLVDGEQTAGVNSVEWNAAGFASGVYFYRLRVGGNSTTMKLLLAR
jgi:hypothetical protein